MILKKSCCCYSLQHGAIVIGIAVMVSSAIALLTEVGMIAEWENIKESIKDPKMQQCKIIFKSLEHLNQTLNQMAT